MSNLRDIKRRIKSVKNTQKITRAMKMVAAAKVKKAEQRVKASRPYSIELLKVIKKVFSTNPVIENADTNFTQAINNYPKLLENRELKTVGLLVVTSDKGLAGAFNANVVRRTISRIRELERSGIQVKLFIIGNKGYSALKKTCREIVKYYTKLPEIHTPGASSVIAEDLAECYVNNEIDRIEIITTTFKSMISFNVEAWQLLPIVISPTQEETKKLESEMLFEPSVEDVLQKVVPLYFSNRIYQAIIESAASELAARMQSMSAATTNAEDIIKLLTVDYNKARQASITQELLEIVNGAEALSS